MIWADETPVRAAREAGKPVTSPRAFRKRKSQLSLALSY
jgi:hypothetical protein